MINRLEQTAHALRLRRGWLKKSAPACTELLQMKAGQVAALEWALTGLDPGSRSCLCRRGRRACR
ncbi:hypothetical protein DIPPA_10900 [Diplonema papillatum]|nr:hypothetical protein DIPPA_10900 [Diplonema papillatum]